MTESQFDSLHISLMFWFFLMFFPVAYMYKSQLVINKIIHVSQQSSTKLASQMILQELLKLKIINKILDKIQLKQKSYM